jgi:hypothetical protein
MYLSAPYHRATEAPTMVGMMTTNPQLVGLGGMARRLGVSTKWLRAEAEAGRVPHLRAGDQLLFVPKVVIAIVAARAGQPQGHLQETAV